ncbi:MAG: DUF2177 family protein [Candidatus Pacebacteria bacterium]|nr:DUF2177 family protein [Candidatus Paceibacterota bacterium]
MLKEFLLTLVTFLMIDLVWLGFLARQFYDQELAGFTRVLRWPAAIAAYLLLALGITWFVLPKTGQQKLVNFFWGAGFGLIVYGVYDLTNYATLKNFTLKMLMVDMLWGAVVCGLVTLLVVSFSSL